MKTVIRNSYTPKLGDYCETIVVDKETGTAYIFDQDGVWTELDQTDVDAILARAAQYTDEQVAPLAEKLDTIEVGAQVNTIEKVTQNGTELTITNKTVNVTVPTKTSDITNDGSDGTDTYVESATLDDYYTKTETDTNIGYETDAREIADAGLQEQIDAIVASSDVVDIVGTYAALQAYDTSKLHDNDIIKVLTDETRDGATTYYRWDADTSTWSYIGAEGPFYTKAESDAIFTPMTRTINSKALSSDITLTAADVHALPDSTVIPTVNDATLTIQKNGTTVQTFTANQASNATANITVPVDTSDLNNDGDGQSPFATEDYVDTYGGKIDTIEVNGTAQPIVNKTVDISVPTKTSDITNDGSDGTSTYVEADDLATVATTGDYDDLTNKPTIPTVNDATLTIQKNGVDVATFTANSATAATANITVPTDTGDLTNGAGFITTAALADYYTKSETYNQTEVNSLINAIAVPTKTSDLTNDGDDGTHPYLATDDVATVATTGNYSDLNGAPGDFTGATSSTAGSHGLVPAPAAGDNTKFLCGDGTWQTVQGGSSSVTEFEYSNGQMYDANSNPVIGSDVLAAFNNGAAIVYDAASFADSEYQIVATDSGTRFIAVSRDSYGEPEVIVLKYMSSVPYQPWGRESYQFQEKLTPGTNITISSGTISAPSAVSAFTNDAGYLTTAGLSNYYTKSETYSQQEVNALISAISVPTKTSELVNDGSDGTSTYVEADDLATVATSGDYDDLTNKPTLPTDFTGATSSAAGTNGLVPAPAAGDQGKVLMGNGTWSTLPAPELVEMSYGESNAWAKFIAAYNAHCIVYCRASSNSDPASGSQTRKAFMAYVNNATTPTQVEFQYYRSVSSHSDSQQGDQVFIYLLTNANGGTWSVTKREAFTKIVAGTNMTSSYSSGTLTLNGATIDSALNISSTNPVQNSVITAALNGKAEVKKFYIDSEYIFRSNGTINQEILDAPGGNAVSAATLFAAMKDGLVMIIANSEGTDHESAIATNARMDSGALKFTIYGSSAADSSIDVMQVVSTGGGYYDFDGYDIVPKNGVLTIQHNGTTVQTFTANQSTNATANIETIWADDIAPATQVPPITSNMIDWSTMEHWSIDVSSNTIVTQTTAYGYVDVPNTSLTFTATVGGVYLVIINAAVKCVGNTTDCYARVLINGGAAATAMSTNVSGQFAGMGNARAFTATQANNTAKIQIGGGRANNDYQIAGNGLSSVQIIRIA